MSAKSREENRKVVFLMYQKVVNNPIALTTNTAVFVFRILFLGSSIISTGRNIESFSNPFKRISRREISFLVASIDTFEA